VKRALGLVAAAAVAAAVAWWYVRDRASRQDLAAGSLAGYNVLLVTIDTLRADRVGAYGGRAGLTPAIDRLAAEGLRFDSMRAHVPLTLPSHASLMTGRLPPRHGVRDNGAYRLDPAQPTLAAALAAAGYRTAAFVGAFVVAGRFGLNTGFDLYDERFAERPLPGRTDVVERRADAVIAPAGAWLRDAAAPWFAWVHLYDPHEPYAPPEPYASRFAAQPYDGEVAYADAALGRLLDGLRAAGRLDRTLVVIAADHGEGLGDHGERTHGLFAYETTLRVPVILWAKDRLRPGVFAGSAGLIDLAPTIADVLGVAWTAGDGVSLRGRLNGEDSDPPPQYFEALNANLTRNWAPLTGVVAGSLKFISLPIPELYDLHIDPGETRNLYDQRGSEADRLEETLTKLASGAPAATGAPIDSATAARLRSLGYTASQPSSRQRRFTAEDDPKALVALDAALDDAMKVAGRGDHDTAAAMLRDVIARRPDLPLAYDRLAFVLRGAGRLDAAIDVLEQSAAKGYADAPALVTLGTLLQEAGRLDRSVQVLEAAVGMNGQDLEARSRLATTYARMGRAADAERAFRAVLDADPQAPEALTNLGVLYLGTNRLPEAIATLEKAVAADPGLGGANNALAVAYARAGDLPKAVPVWQRLLAAQPDNPDLLYNLGTALLRLERPREARPVLERFIAVAPPQYAADVARLRDVLERLPR
jgi:arylsulfatase A-like enzyme/Tfp pilus assembly protein PilF